MSVNLPIVLVGLPGAGKSKVGRLLASRLGVDHVDTDDLVEERQGRPIADIFAIDGEAAFRVMETDAVACALTRSAVVSLGGGAAATQAVRDLLAGHTVVYIDAPHNELVRRTASKTHRPLLATDPDGALRRLREAREPHYRAVATLTVPSGPGPADSAATKVLIVHARPLAARAQALAEHLRSLGYEAATADHPDAEAGKAIEVVAGLWDTCGRLQLGRKDAIIAMGGGATTDMAGFVAATWLRGVSLINVPTTLLGMVDAAVGGKTGINTSVGKNLVGSFYPARAVVADMSLLSSLPREDLAAGAAEVIKCGFIADPVILRIVEETDTDVLLDPSSEQLAEITTRAVAVKARVVSADLTEGGLREILNYGHTLAHAIERANDYTWRHGDAVAVGCCFAARLAHARGQLSAEDVARHDELFSRVGLPTRYEGHTLEELTHIMASDKKVRRGVLRFVLLDGIANPRTEAVEPGELAAPAEAIGIRP